MRDRSLNKQGVTGYKLEKMLQKALAHLQQGQLDKAEKQYKVILKKHPKHAEALHLQGIVFNRKGRGQLAVESIRKAIKINPSEAGYYFNLGVVLQEMGGFEDAVDAYENALKLQPKNAEAWDNLGSALQHLERYLLAVDMHQKAIELKPAQASIWSNLGESFRKQLLFTQAIDCYRKALAIEPYYAGGLINLGNVYKEVGQIDKALEIFSLALSVQNVSEAEKVEIHWNYSLLLLMLGQFSKGWVEHEWGLMGDELRTNLNYPLPVWDGTELSNKHLLLIAEQGVGDEIMFSSCFKDVISQAKKITIECDQRLASLFKRSFPSVGIYLKSKGSVNTLEGMNIDYQLAMGSLPRFYRNNESDFPEQAGYLVVDSQKKQVWEERFKQLGEELKIGISWKGGKDKEVRRKRSALLLECWLPLLKTKGVKFINLQYGDCKEELKMLEQQLNIIIYDWDDANPVIDQDNFAAQVAALDLVISIDNATVHMAGALGIPTWVMLPCVPDWRWQRGRVDSPWYPSLILFRQKTADDWGGVFNEVGEKLQLILKSGSEAGATIKNGASKVILVNSASNGSHWGSVCSNRAIIEHLQNDGFEVSTISTDEIQHCINSPQDISDFDSDIFCQTFVNSNSLIIQKITEADIVVVNGGAVLEGLTAVAMTLLYIAYLSKLGLNKPVHIINHSCYPEGQAKITDALKNGLYKKVYQYMDSVAIREPESAGLMQQLGINVIQSLDCLPLYIWQQGIKAEKVEIKNILVAGFEDWDILKMSLLNKFMQIMSNKGYRVQILLSEASEEQTLVKAMEVETFTHWQPVKVKTNIDRLQVIANAKLVLSDDLNFVLSAFCLKVPSIALDNTTEMSGLLQMLSLSPPISCESTNLLEKLQSRAEEVLETNEVLLSDKKMNELLKLSFNNFLAIEVVKEQ